MYNIHMELYELKNDIIYVYDKSQFNPKHILECGQVFRFGIDENNNYFVISNKHKATIIEKPNHYEIVSNNPEYFVNYFDLNTDYSIIKNKLKTNPILAPMIEYGYGIRILKADPEEMIFSFILSQNNNIKRIQKIVDTMCEIGEDCGDYKGFPTTETLHNQKMNYFKNLGAGYRDKFLKSVADTLYTIDLEEVKSYETDKLYNFLLLLNGVGPKVASCILLFGFGRMDKFPVDTWLEQVYYNHFSKEPRNRAQIQEYFENEFKENSGLAQQYLFYYEREKTSK